jgi:hypothetical protein
MNKRQFRVQLKNGKEPIKFFKSPSEAKLMYGNEILKFIEVITMTDQIPTSVKTTEVGVVFYNRTDKEVFQSNEIGYSPIDVRLISKKITIGTMLFEIGENSVLMSEISGVEKYDKILHHQWKDDPSIESKHWKYIVNHTKSSVITIDDYIKQYGKIHPTKSGVGYINLKK